MTPKIKCSSRELEIIEIFETFRLQTNDRKLVIFASVAYGVLILEFSIIQNDSFLSQQSIEAMISALYIRWIYRNRLSIIELSK